jgi:tRNA threonylcarbamoyladenosine biosynthesis protein TsaB
MTLLALDTSTPATVVGVGAADGALLAERRHDPGPGERPGHAAQVLALAEAALDEAGLALSDVRRVGAGVGPGTFTGLRIGVSTARALAQGLGCEVVALSSLEALALPAAVEHDGPVAAVLDARRGEAFVATWDRSGAPLAPPRAVAPEGLAAVLDPAQGRWLAVGDGAIRFRDGLEAANATVPEHDSPLHRVGAAALCRLTAQGPATDRDGLVPDYVRAPDAVPRR